MSWGDPVRNGLSVGIGTLVSLTSGSGVGGRSRRGEPTLIIDFVPVDDPVYGATLSTDFTAQQYQTYTRDPVDPTGFIDIQVWN